MRIIEDHKVQETFDQRRVMSLANDLAQVLREVSANDQLNVGHLVGQSIGNITQFSALVDIPRFISGIEQGYISTK
jgi:hypothetical protein